jgi:hypothetical protein
VEQWLRWSIPDGCGGVWQHSRIIMRARPGYAIGAFGANILDEWPHIGQIPHKRFKGRPQVMQRAWTEHTAVKPQYGPRCCPIIDIDRQDRCSTASPRPLIKFRGSSEHNLRSLIVAFCPRISKLRCPSYCTIATKNKMNK